MFASHTVRVPDSVNQTTQNESWHSKLQLQIKTNIELPAYQLPFVNQGSPFCRSCTDNHQRIIISWYRLLIFLLGIPQESLSHKMQAVLDRRKGGHGPGRSLRGPWKLGTRTRRYSVRQILLVTTKYNHHLLVHFMTHTWGIHGAVLTLFSMADCGNVVYIVKLHVCSE